MEEPYIYEATVKVAFTSPTRFLETDEIRDEIEEAVQNQQFQLTDVAIRDRSKENKM